MAPGLVSWDFLWSSFLPCSLSSGCWVLQSFPSTGGSLGAGRGAVHVGGTSKRHRAVRCTEHLHSPGWRLRQRQHQRRSCKWLLTAYLRPFSEVAPPPLPVLPPNCSSFQPAGAVLGTVLARAPGLLCGRRRFRGCRRAWRTSFRVGLTGDGSATLVVRATDPSGRALAATVPEPQQLTCSTLRVV